MLYVRSRWGGYACDACGALRRRSEACDAYDAHVASDAWCMTRVRRVTHMQAISMRCKHRTVEFLEA